MSLSRDPYVSHKLTHSLAIIHSFLALILVIGTLVWAALLK